MIKIAHLNNISQLSGSQLVSIQVLEALPASEFHRTIICGIDANGMVGFEQRCRSSNINPIFLRSSSRKIGLSDIDYFFDLLKVFREGKYDIIHTNSTKQGIIGRIAAKCTNTKVIIHTVHGIAYHKGQPYLKRCLLYFLEIFGTFFCHQQVLVNKYYSKYYKWMPWLKSLTIKNGVSDLELLNYEKKTGIESVPKLKKVVLFLGRLEAQKDPMTLLRAINYLKLTNQSLLDKTVFKFVGDGNLAEYCFEYAKANHLLGYVNFTGWSDDKWKELLSADVLCGPSIHEACGLVFLEAGLCKIPVVATDTEGIPEVVVHGKTGLLSPIQDHISLSENLVTLLTDSAYSDQLGENSREYVLEAYKLLDMQNQYLKLYKKMLEVK